VSKLDLCKTTKTRSRADETFLHFVNESFQFIRQCSIYGRREQRR